MLGCPHLCPELQLPQEGPDLQRTDFQRIVRSHPLQIWFSHMSQSSPSPLKLQYLKFKQLKGKEILVKIPLYNDDSKNTSNLLHTTVVSTCFIPGLFSSKNCSPNPCHKYQDGNDPYYVVTTITQPVAPQQSDQNEPRQLVTQNIKQISCDATTLMKFVSRVTSSLSQCFV